MRRALPGAVLLLLALAAVAGEPPLRGARFTVFAGGREAGTEVVTVSGNGETTTIESRARLSRADRVQELALRIVLDAGDGRILSFFARGVQDERERVVTLARSDGRLVGEIREGESADPVDFAVEPGAVILAEPFAAPYLLLARRYDRERGGPQTFPALFPLLGRSGEVTLALREREALEVDGEAVLTERVRVTPTEGDTANLWLDVAGEVVVCARSVAGISAVRGRVLRIGLAPGEDPPDPPDVASIRIRFAAGSNTLAGTFSRARDGPERQPAVLLITGSGPHDRNGNVPGAELQWNAQHSFAVALAEEGIASLRYDERGVGRSGGTFYDAGFTDLTRDAGAALTYLASREDVDPARLAILGHSEGALIAAKLAGGGRSRVRAVVLIGAPAEPLDRILIDQVRRRLAAKGTKEREVARIVGEMRAFFEFARLSGTDVVRWKGRVREVRWLREHMALDPIATYRSVRARALVLAGERDAQVPAAHAKRVGEAIGDGAEVRILPTLDHFLMPTRGGLDGYGDARRRVAPAALHTVREWLRTALH